MKQAAKMLELFTIVNFIELSLCFSFLFLLQQFNAERLYDAITALKLTTSNGKPEFSLTNTNTPFLLITLNERQQFHTDKILISISLYFGSFFLSITYHDWIIFFILFISLMINLHANELCFQLVRRVIKRMLIQCAQYPNDHSNRS